MNNLEIYNKYREVPKEALKPFDNGNFKGTDINSMWRIKCLTEQFGVVGHGWTTKVLRTWTETDANTNEILAFAEIEMKVKINGEWGEPFTATGGNKLSSYIKSKDYYKTSDEAFKMAITDAFGVACKYLGIGANVYWDNDKSKYTETEPKEMTVEEAKNYTFSSGGKQYTLGNLTTENLEWLLENTKNEEIKKAVTILLQQ